MGDNGVQIIKTTFVSDPPTGANKTISIREDSSHRFSAGDSGFGDPDTGDSLAGVRITSLQSAGSLTLSGTQVTRDQVVSASDIEGLVFEPVAGESGSPYATFRFRVSDGAAYSAGANAVTVNVTPATLCLSAASSLDPGADPPDADPPDADPPAIHLGGGLVKLRGRGLCDVIRDPVVGVLGQVPSALLAFQTALGETGEP